MDTPIRPEDIQESKVIAILAYLSILCIIPLTFKKNNPFVLFHGKQGLVLFVGEVAVFVITVIPVVGLIIGKLGFLIFGVCSLLGILQVLMGKYAKMPVVWAIAEKIVI